MVKRPSLNSMSPSECFQDMRDELLALGDNLVAHRNDGAAAHGGRARAAGAHTERYRVGVAGDELDPVRINAEFINEHLGLDRGMALAVRDRAGDEGHAAERIEADFRGLIGGICRLLDGIGDADAAQHAASRCLSASRLKASPVGKLHGAVEVLRKASGVVGEDERRFVRHRLRRNGVAAAQLGGIDFHFIGSDVDQSLDHVGGFRPTRAAIRRCAMGVG